VKVEAIDHIHINVKDIRRAMRLFTALIDSEYREPMVIEETQSLFAYNDLGLYLNQPLSEESPNARWIAKRGEGLAAISFGVKNLDERIAEAQALGLKLVSRIGYEGVEDQAQFHPKDSFGVPIELNERLAGFAGVSDRPVDAFHQGVDHVHIYVQDIDRAVDLFTSLTGYEFHDPVTVDEVQLSAASNALGLDLLQPTSPDSPIARVLNSRGEGAHAMAFRASNVEEGIARAQSAGLTLVSQTGYEGMMRQAQFHSKDTFGIMIEFAERIGTY